MGAKDEAYYENEMDYGRFGNCKLPNFTILKDD